MRCILQFLWRSSLTLALLPGAASAAIVGPGDGTQNTTQPPGVPGWNNVGQLNDGSGVYLGNGWVITPRHVGPGTITFDAFPSSPGGSYNWDGGATVSITNSNGSLADLILFHLASSPSLPSLTIATSSPTIGTSFTNMGYGLDRATTVSYYNSDFSSSTNSVTSTYGGFALLDTHTKRWGTNTVMDQGAGQSTATITVNGINETAFAADFYTDKAAYLAGAGTSSEDYLSAGDSGGAVFNSANELIGLNEAIGTYDNQPGNLALFGDVSYMTDLATYHDQIVSAVPEPATGMLLFTACIPLLRRRARV